MYEKIKEQTLNVFKELIEKANLKSGDLVVLGCSTSVVTGSIIGTSSTPECAEEMYKAFYPLLKEKGIYLAAQCCEHLERALVVEREYAKTHNLEIVNVIPIPKAGGSNAVTAYKTFDSPVVVDGIKADAGVDIGGTLIGMHIRRVAVPIKMENNKIGGASVICARSRPRFVGGERAVYDKNLM